VAELRWFLEDEARAGSIVVAELVAAADAAKAGTVAEGESDSSLEFDSDEFDFDA
jgi:hypothetical protein